jgi:hypothetical protein
MLSVGGKALGDGSAFLMITAVDVYTIPFTVRHISCKLLPLLPRSRSTQHLVR